MNKKLIAIAVAGAMTAPMAAQAVKYKLSGQVNRAVIFVDDGVDSQVRNVDNTASGTRFRLRGSEDLGNGVTAGFYWELQTMSNRNGGGAGDGPQSQGEADAFDIRQANVFFSGGFGKLTIGQQSAAADGTMGADLSGTGAVNSAAVTTYAGSTTWRTTGGGNAAAVGGTYSNFDGGRLDAIRYDSPALGPVTISASVGNDSYWDVAARASGGLGGGKYSLALQYQDASGRDGAAGGPGTSDTVQYGGSLAYLFSQGTSISGHYGRRDTNVTGADEADSYSVKLGHKWGPHAASIQYAAAQDVTQGYDANALDLAYVYSIKKASAIVYAGFQHNWADAPAAVGSIDDVNLFYVGSRVQFD